jgi:hypothetical protein
LRQVDGLFRRISDTIKQACLAGLILTVSPGAFAAGDRILDRRELQALAHKVVPRKKTPPRWADAVWRALAETGIKPRKANVCSVLAVIEQESNFEANPEVRDLGRISEAALLEKLRGVPILSKQILAFLRSRPDARRNYLKLIRAAKTERDLDLVWRNIAYYLFNEYAAVALMNVDPFKSLIERGNEIGTIGSMQVSLSFAISEVERRRGRTLDLAGTWALRDELYTPDGGVRYGARMLLGYYANYPSRLYVFADYNAGRYASRNAAFQFALGQLLGRDVPRDGDLLIYRSGAVSGVQSQTERAIVDLSDRYGLGLAAGQVRRDLLKEKTYRFSETPTAVAVRGLYRSVNGRAAPYAMVPDIKLRSPKLSRSMSTERFARAVYRRYEKCLRL